jgi:hypothetical protein
MEKAGGTSKEFFLQQFVFDTLDICDTKVALLFIKDQTVNYNVLILHPLSKCHIMFCQAWYCIYNNFPTKDNFQELINIMGGLDAILSNSSTIVSPENVVHALSQHTAFMVWHMLQKGSVLIDTILKKLKENPLTTKDIENTLVEKWLYRCHNRVSNTSFEMIDNLLQKYVKIHIAYKKQIEQNPLQYRPCMLKFQPNLQHNDATQMTTMTTIEKIQYSIHRNNRFMLHMQTAYFIISCDAILPQCIINSFNAVINTKLCILYIDVEPTQQYNNDVDCYMLSKDEFRLLPKIFQNVCCINTPKFVEEYISMNSNNNIYIAWNSDKSQTHNISQNKTFKFVLTNQVSHSDPLQDIYYLPDNISNESQNYLVANYLKFNSPFKLAKIENNALLYNHFMAINISNSISINNNQNIKAESISSENVILAVDTRFNVATYYAVVLSYLNLLKHSTQKWDIVICTKAENSSKYHWFNQERIKLKIISHPLLDNTTKFSIETYNAVLKDAFLWNSLKNQGYRKCLVVQDDGFLVNSSKIDDYMKYDYVGAPWADVTGNQYIKYNIYKELVGNGGFSLRDVDMMFLICNKYQQEKTLLFFNNLNEIPEDVYFVKCLVAEKASIATKDEATYFSIEQVVPVSKLDTVIGFHKFWMYHPPSTVWKVFKAFLELP